MGARLSAAGDLDRDITQAITAMVRKRVPPSEVDDIVQSTLAEAVASPEAPVDKDALRRWLSGVARHKVADFHRRRGREVALDSAPELPGGPAPYAVEERDLLRWARRQLPSDEAQQTLDWMMHEADGEKLEAIAERERIPATRVRQRVSRLRAFFRERWHRELALASVLVLVVVVGWVLARKRPDAPQIAHDPPHVVPRAEILRGEAERECARGAFRECLDKLDEAKRLDPAGDDTPSIRESRRAAERALEPPAPPPVAPTSVPTNAKPRSIGPTPTSSVAPTKPRTPTKPTSELPADFWSSDGLGSSSAGSSGGPKRSPK